MQITEIFPLTDMHNVNGKIEVHYHYYKNCAKWLFNWNKQNWNIMHQILLYRPKRKAPKMTK